MKNKFSKKIFGNIPTVLLIAIIAALQGCKNDPEACISASTAYAIPGEVVHFNNCSKNGDSYQWDFGDGTSSLIDAPSKVYSSTGSFTVNLLAIGKSKSNTASLNMFVGTPYLGKFIINSISGLTGAATELGVYISQPASPGYSYDSTNNSGFTFPITINATGTYNPMTPGITYTGQLTVRYSNFGGQNINFSFTPNVSSDIIHINNGQINMDIYRVIE